MLSQGSDLPMKFCSSDWQRRGSVSLCASLSAAALSAPGSTAAIISPCSSVPLAGRSVGQRERERESERERERREITAGCGGGLRRRPGDMPTTTWYATNYLVVAPGVW